MMAAGGIQLNLQLWLKEANLFIMKRNETGVWNSQELRKLIDTFERRIYSTNCIWNVNSENVMAPRLMEQSKETYRLLQRIAKEHH